MSDKYEIEVRNDENVIVSRGEQDFRTPSLHSQNHQIADSRDLEECVFRMNWAYKEGLKDKAEAIREKFKAFKDEMG